MVKLVYEIWFDKEDNSYETAPVSKQSDKLRAGTRAIMLHTYTAESDHEGFQKSYDWLGYGQWKPVPGCPERFFTTEDAEEQRCYMETRDVG